jgi:hypothetical protein
VNAIFFDPKQKTKAVPDVRFAVVGPRSWENSAVVYRVLQRLCGKYGAGRLMLITGDGPGLAKVAREQAMKCGIHATCVIPALHGVYGRRAEVLAWNVVLELEPRFVVAFSFASLRDGSHQGVRDAWILSKRAGVPVKNVKVGPRTAMLSAERHHRMQAERKTKKRRRDDRGRPKG